MNVTKRECEIFFDFYQTSDLDMRLLQTASGIAAILIIVANVYLIRLLWRKRYISINLLFIIQSCFDMFTGVVVIPMFLLTATNIDENVYCRVFYVAQFTYMFVSSYPWFMIVFIAIDRYLIITKPLTVHEKYMTRRSIYLYVFMFTVFNCIISIWFVLAGGGVSGLNVAFVLHMLMVFISFTVIFSLYIHLVIYVCKRNKIMKGSRHDNKKENYSIRTAKTVFLVLLCLVCCNVSTAGAVMYLSQNHYINSKITMNISGWFNLLLYMNSCFNVIIIVSCSKNFKKKAKEKQQLKFDGTVSSTQ